VDSELRYDIGRALAGLFGRLDLDRDVLPPLTKERIAQDVRAAFADCDLQQLAITRRMTPAQRFRQVSELNAFLRGAMLASIRRAHPGIGDPDMQRQFLRRMGINISG
jgi:hypothetical protein